MTEGLDDLPEIEPEEKDLVTEPEGDQTDGEGSDSTDNELPDDLDTEDAGSGLRIRARDLAVSQIGVGESPLGSNCQPYSRYFGAGCDYWCVYFLSWAFDRAGNQDRRVPWSASSSRGVYDWGRANNMLASVPASGDILILRDFSHSAIVRGVDQQGGAMNTIDGNWSNKVLQVSGRNFRQTGYYFVRVNLATV